MPEDARGIAGRVGDRQLPPHLARARGEGALDRDGLQGVSPADAHALSETIDGERHWDLSPFWNREDLRRSPGRGGHQTERDDVLVEAQSRGGRGEPVVQVVRIPAVAQQRPGKETSVPHHVPFDHVHAGGCQGVGEHSEGCRLPIRKLVRKPGVAGSIQDQIPAQAPALDRTSSQQEGAITVVRPEVMERRRRGEQLHVGSGRHRLVGQVREQGVSRLERQREHAEARVASAQRAHRSLELGSQRENASVQIGFLEGGHRPAESEREQRARAQHTRVEARSVRHRREPP